MNYTASALGNEYKICGINLQPLTLGHGVLLEASELDPVKDKAQLPLALFICSRPWRDGKAQMDSDWFNFRFSFFNYAVQRRMDDDKLAHWHHYIWLNSQLPKSVPTSIGEKAVSESTSCTPWIQYVRMYLLANLNYKPESVNDAPYQQGMWDMISHLEFSGNINLHDPDDWAAMKEKLSELNPEKPEEKNRTESNGRV